MTAIVHNLPFHKQRQNVSSPYLDGTDYHLSSVADCFCQPCEPIFYVKLLRYEPRFCNRINHIGKACSHHPLHLHGFEDVDPKPVDYETLFRTPHKHTFKNLKEYMKT